MARSMRVLILVVLEMASSAMPRCSRCLRSFSPNAPTAELRRTGWFSVRIEMQIMIGEMRGNALAAWRVCGESVGQRLSELKPRFLGILFTVLKRCATQNALRGAEAPLFHGIVRAVANTCESRSMSRSKAADGGVRSTQLFPNSFLRQLLVGFFAEYKGELGF